MNATTSNLQETLLKETQFEETKMAHYLADSFIVHKHIQRSTQHKDNNNLKTNLRGRIGIIRFPRFEYDKELTTSTDPEVRFSPLKPGVQLLPNPFAIGDAHDLQHTESGSIPVRFSGPNRIHLTLMPCKSSDRQYDETADIFLSVKDVNSRPFLSFSIPIIKGKNGVQQAVPISGMSLYLGERCERLSTKRSRSAIRQIISFIHNNAKELAGCGTVGEWNQERQNEVDMHKEEFEKFKRFWELSMSKYIMHAYVERSVRQVDDDYLKDDLKGCVRVTGTKYVYVSLLTSHVTSTAEGFASVGRGLVRRRPKTDSDPIRVHFTLMPFMAGDLGTEYDEATDMLLRVEDFNSRPFLSICIPIVKDKGDEFRAVPRSSWEWKRNRTGEVLSNISSLDAQKQFLYVFENTVELFGECATTSELDKKQRHAVTMSEDEFKASKAFWKVLFVEK